MKPCLKLLLLFACLVVNLNTFAQMPVRHLSLNDCIAIATDSTLTAFRAKNMYLAGYWEYRTYRSQRLPAITLQLTPIQYNSTLVKRYDSNQNIDIYRQQQSFGAYGGLSVSQNVDFTGGTLIVDTDLDFMRNFGTQMSKQYSSVPIRIGYSQSLFGFNRFKWEKKIEPLKFEKTRQQFLYSREEIAETTVGYFFTLAMAQAEYDLAVENIRSTDSLYRAGKERRRISSISEADLLTLDLDRINAENTYETAILQLEKALAVFRSFLGIDKNTEISLVLPDHPLYFPVSQDEALLYVQENHPLLLENTESILQAEQTLEQTSKAAGFDASLSASMGYNRAASTLKEAYIDPSRRDMLQVSISIPIVDWGIRKGRVNMAKNNLNVTKLSAQQQEQDLEQEINILVLEFNKQQSLIRKAAEAMQIAINAYDINKQRFIIGKADINSVILSSNRRKEAQRNYLNILGNYWSCYYAIRKLTLYDFQKEEKLSFPFEYLLE